jgi:hypothetical protein
MSMGCRQSGAMNVAHPVGNMSWCRPDTTCSTLLVQYRHGECGGCTDLMGMLHGQPACMHHVLSLKLPTPPPALYDYGYTSLAFIYE